MSRIDLIQLRGGTAAQWTTANPILAAREPGLETDTQKVKYGNGTDHWADLPYASGGAGITDGAGAGFTGGSGVSVPIDGLTVGFIPFLAIDQPPRAPQRDDLMVIDGGDQTTINVVRSGLYDIALNLPVAIHDLVFNTDPPSGNPVQVTGTIQFNVNGFDPSEPPINLYNNFVYWSLTNVVDTSVIPVPIPYCLTFPQVLLAGDTIQVGLVAAQTGFGFPVETISGTFHAAPDITMYATYRGPVAA